MLENTLHTAFNQKPSLIPLSPPLWMMRQAGRYLPEYRALREKAGDFWTLCLTPEYASEVTLQPVQRFGYDAAILFSDILVIPRALGQVVHFLPTHGPRLEPLEWPKVLDRDSDWETFQGELTPIYQALRETKKKLTRSTSLIGFAGTPWTLATYMLDLGKGKGPSKDFSESHKALHNPLFLNKLLDSLSQAITRHLINQIKAGADVVQLFDSWAGIVPISLRQQVLVDPLKQIIKGIRDIYPTTPIIYFGRQISDSYPYLLDELEQMGPLFTQNFALGIDQTTDIAWARKTLQDRVCLQGNLDPECLRAGGEKLTIAVLNILRTLSRGAHIFNLGHGILPNTPISHVEHVIELVRNYGK
jgi:uroporphyrinogen decarboxylase